MMKSLAFASLLLLSAPAAQAARLPGDALKFSYETFDGETRYPCKHERLNEASPYDWKVRCYEGAALRREYVAHVSLERYVRTTRPELSIELLYWVTGTGIETETGGTTWFHLAKDSPLLEVSTSATVDRATAGLYLDILLP
jgi:hypothetical protein